VRVYRPVATCLATTIAFSAVATTRVHAAAGSLPVDPTTANGRFSFTYGTPEFPCPITTGCGGQITTGTFNGTVSGLDLNDHPFVMTFTATGPDVSGNADSAQQCGASPVAELLGWGSAGFFVSGGQLIDNGVNVPGATLEVDLQWNQEGIAIYFNFTAVVWDSAGNMLAANVLTPGTGVGTFIPNWGDYLNPPLNCFDQFPATITVSGGFGGDA